MSNMVRYGLFDESDSSLLRKCALFYLTISSDGGITINITNNITINDTQKKILAQMQANPKITTKDLAKTLGIADRNVKNHIKFLKEAGLIERVGSPKSGHWVIKQNGDTQGQKKKD